MRPWRWIKIDWPEEWTLPWPGYLDWLVRCAAKSSGWFDAQVGYLYNKNLLIARIRQNDKH